MTEVDHGVTVPQGGNDTGHPHWRPVPVYVSTWGPVNEDRENGGSFRISQTPWKEETSLAGKAKAAMEELGNQAEAQMEDYRILPYANPADLEEFLALIQVHDFLVTDTTREELEYLLRNIDKEGFTERQKKQSRAAIKLLLAELAKS